MPLSTFAFTMLAIAAILVWAGAPLLAVYIVCGIGAVWQLLVSLAAAGTPPMPPVDDDEPRDA